MSKKKPVIEVEHLGGDVWETTNLSNGHKHPVTYTTAINGLVCECDGFHFEKHCQHVDAVKEHDTYKKWLSKNI